MPIRALLRGLFLLSLMTGVAQAQSLQVGSGIDLAPTILPAPDVAGLSTGTTREIGWRGRFQAIQGLMFAERADRPCYIEARTRNIRTLSTPTPRSLNTCDHRNDFTNRSRRFALPGFALDRRFVWQIQVCNSTVARNDHRLKGMRVWWAEVSEDGAINRFGTEREAKQPNCDTGDWGDFSTCPEGAIATRLELHLTSESRGDVLSGIRLLCRQVRSSPFAATLGSN